MLKTTLSLYEFDCAREYLAELFKLKQSQRSSYSLRQFALYIGFSDSGSLSRILSGKRVLTIERAKKVAQKLQLDSSERLYFFQMVLLQDMSDEIRLPLLLCLKTAFSKLKFLESTINEEHFHSIADYQCLAVRECLRLKNPPSSSEDLEIAWQASPSTPDFETLVSKLESLGLVVREKDQLKAHDKETLVFNPGKTSQAIRHYHSDWLNAAQHALHHLPTEERLFHGATLAIPKWAYQEASEKITRLHKELLELSVEDSADQVVHVGSFLLPVAKAGEPHV